MKVLGIDPSLSATGLAGYEGRLSTLKTKFTDKDFRLQAIYDGTADLAADAKVTVGEVRAVIEDLPKQAMGAGITGMVQGVVRLALMDYDIPYIKIPPATLKKFATGKGNADKAAMRAAWLQFSGLDNLDDNQVDAAFLRLIGIYLSGQHVNLPPLQLAAVAAYKDDFNGN